MAKAVRVDFIQWASGNVAVQSVDADGYIVHVGNEYGHVARHQPNEHVRAELRTLAERWARFWNVPVTTYSW